MGRRAAAVATGHSQGLKWPSDEVDRINAVAKIERRDPDGEICSRSWVEVRCEEMTDGRSRKRVSPLDLGRTPDFRNYRDSTELILTVAPWIRDLDRFVQRPRR